MALALDREDFRKLAHFVDFHELRGFQVRVNRLRSRFVPVWVMEDEKLRRVVLHRCRNRERHAFRAACLYLYYRVPMSSVEVAEFLGRTVEDVEYWIHSSKKIAAFLFNDISQKTYASTQYMEGENGHNKHDDEGTDAE